MERINLKKWAKEKVKGNVWRIFALYLFVSLISMIPTIIKIDNDILPIIITIIISFTSFILNVGLVKYMINFINDNPSNINMLFSKFKYWKQMAITYFRIYINVFLWSILLIIPGIIKAYSYSLVTYILADNPNISSKDALKLSEDMMHGHKLELFLLQISFSGWQILSIFTLFLLEIWIIPYKQTTITKFLNDIKIKYEKEVIL